MNKLEAMNNRIDMALNNLKIDISKLVLEAFKDGQKAVIEELKKQQDDKGRIIKP